MIYIEPGFFCFAAVMLLVCPLPWLLASVFAALVHEMCHLAAVMFSGGYVRRIRVGVMHAQIEAVLEGDRGLLFAAMAGPAGSLFLILLKDLLPEVAVCGMIQGLFNLLPVKPLDGWNVVRCILLRLFPGNAPWILELVEIITLLLSVPAACCLAASVLGDFRPGIAAAVPAVIVILRKIPCKQGEKEVQ